MKNFFWLKFFYSELSFQRGITFDSTCFPSRAFNQNARTANFFEIHFIMLKYGYQSLQDFEVSLDRWSMVTLECKVTILNSAISSGRQKNDRDDMKVK